MSRNYNSSNEYDNYDNRRESFSSRGGYRGRGSHNGYQRDFSRGGYTGNSSGSSYSSSPYQPHRQSSKDGFPSNNEQESRGNSTVNVHSSEGDSRSNSGVSTPNKHENEYDNQERTKTPEGRYSSDYRSSGFNGNGRSGYRVNYRGGYRGRGGSYNSPYARDAPGPGYQGSTSRQSSYTDQRGPNSPYYHSRHSDAGSHQPYQTSKSYTQQQQSHTQRQHTPQLPEKAYQSPWIKLLSLDSLKTSDKKLEPELVKLRDEREELYKKSLKNQEKLKDLKLKNMKLEFEIDVLKTAICRDQLNIDITQEKLDAISLI